MQRLNFYKLNINKDYYNFKKTLITSSNDIEAGYINTLESKDDCLHAIFYKKISINERILNPLGDYENINYYIYQNIEFYIFSHNKNVTLCIINQPKSIKNFIAFLKKNDSLFFSLGNYSIDIKKSLENNTLKILKAKFIDVELSTKSFANIEINSNYNALSDFELFKLKGTSELVKVKVIENYKNLYLESEFNSKATFSIKIEHLDFNLISYFYYKYINIL
ncbi:TPA: hypothetical protein JI136_10260 [Acinetobacter baumannii]|uniref:hypothetical protein n=4 Tax=Acinetobacter calcoaceticus/baumannii complex TaxID=909768 RepID=UPI000DA68E24|nr:hypothetical protein [Acinetobacter baumannii]MCZ0665155.1 hypothetical protein [Acinetobacter baumannii]HAV2816641.1 hypothetical protein [Acinetobacter baumannii]HAV5699381.1 hypothetical protein [Acinetobacter baumannii]HAV5726812.1 hypothetical protein [Acinetobacter baumannii]HAV5730607.1 hypothetical protein [Acinetobacter baumannii]